MRNYLQNCIRNPLRLFLVVLSIAVGSTSGQIAAAKPAYVQVFQAVWETVNEKFFDPSFTGVDWKAIGDRYRPQAERAKSDAELHALMQKMLRELPVSHLQISMPRGTGLFGTGIVTHSIEGRTVVVSVPEASDARAKGIRVGDIILNPSDEEGPLGTYSELRVRGCDGRIRTAKVRRESHSQPERPSLRWRTFYIGEGKRVGYIKAVRFDDDVAPLVDAAMAELKNTSGIIIDVRDNSGGNMSFVRLSSYFAEGEHLVAALLTRSYLEAVGATPKEIDPGKLPKATKTYTDEAIFNAMRTNAGAVGIYSEDMGANRYRGEVALLINEETASAAEGFTWHMKLRTGAKLIGRKTAGALLGAEYFTLPGGWRLGVPTHSGWGPDGKPVIDEPVVPHVSTKWSRQNICNGTDPDMVEAMAILN